MALAPPLPKQHPKSLQAVLLRRRIAISVVLFWSLIATAMVRGVQPRDFLDYRDTWSMAGLVLVLLGVLMRTWAAGTLVKSTQLTTTGPYRLVRNPLYLGSLLLLIGFGLLIGDPWLLALSLIPAVGLYYLKVRAEETFLHGKFGGAWDEFAARTPRLLPCRLPRGDGTWSLTQWLDNREYQALLATVAGLVALQVWRAMI